MAFQAWEGMRLLHLTRHVASSLCNKVLADYGTDVIKTEAPGKGRSCKLDRPIYCAIQRCSQYLARPSKKMGMARGLSRRGRIACARLFERA